ncbi:DNA endonuclease SmrA [Alteromonas sediminis]|uniref:DNA endonuclease SmrA n=1 Tax=Alteromonas sediminis TaxID=2259342 RepID=A0A3N5XYF8_9ALTE|nr:DNA endonuclease SmrA [Alteromonas sediminis]RPJ64936.1 DNA endonuclease SmrA [Alteromonas sediminis]
MEDNDFFEEDFFAELADVKPLSQDKVNPHSASLAIEKKKKVAERASQQDVTAVPLSFNNIKPVQPDDFLSYKQAGIQDGVFKNLRLGKYHIDKRVDLSGLTIKESASSLYHAIVNGHENGFRAILIRHGRGENSKPFPGFKKSHVQHWLSELEQVIAYHSALPVHGGLGATYVLLKKHPNQKLINRELNRRR